MSLYESLANKPAVVLDIGHAYTKCGFAGDASPFAIIPTQLTKQNGECVNIFDMEHNQTQLKELLIEFLYKIYYKILNANSKERKVVIIESVLCTSEFRKALADVLFKNFQVMSIGFLSSHMSPLYTLGISKALVLDCGYSDCQIMPIAENLPMSGLCSFMNLGGKGIHEHIEIWVRKYAKVIVNGQTGSIPDSLILSEDTLEDIKLRCCFVSPFDRIQKYYDEIEKKKLSGDVLPADFEFKFASDCKYTLPNNFILSIPGFVRELALEFLFRGPVDPNHTITCLILDTILNSPIDYRKDFMKNIVFTGGTCMLFGFKNRLVAELNHAVSNSTRYAKHFYHKQFKFYEPPCHDNHVAWLGGSIFGSMESLDYYSILNSKYKDIQKLPDWFMFYQKNSTDAAHKI
jgi:actin-related protein 10